MSRMIESARPARAHHHAAAIERAEIARLRLWADRQGFRPAPSCVGPVRQQAEIAVARLQSALPDPLGRLVARLQSLVAEPRWSPNEATVMRYPVAGAGISPHRDHRRFVHAIAVVSLEGEALFSTFDGTRKRTLTSWRCRPGDVVVIAGPDPARAEGADPRPIHGVAALGGARASLTLRMEV